MQLAVELTLGPIVMTGLLMLNTLSCLFGMIAVTLCLVAWRRLRDTTMAAPCAWAAASLAVATGSVLSTLVLAPARPSVHVDYLAGMMMVAPFVALLGAKRPQNRAWQWIVVSLIGLLVFQDLRSWSIDAAALPSLHAAWRWLLAALIVVQLLNYLTTRHAAAACVACPGQACILAGYLPFPPERSALLLPLGLALLSVAVMMAAAFACRRRRSAEGWQAAWLDFRDLYGALWALRVAERVNSIAVEQSCPMRLNWHGFARAELSADSATEAPCSKETAPLQRALRSVLTRFVSTDWLAKHGASQNS